ncbi:hypothetical protein BGX38DRAFT_1190353 [Terfezia claveryi]|nr:hypothetical protein BGX38DRAFT_1190353 [Terfezia claveryi]
MIRPCVNVILCSISGQLLASLSPLTLSLYNRYIPDLRPWRLIVTHAQRTAERYGMNLTCLLSKEPRWRQRGRARSETKTLYEKPS